MDMKTERNWMQLDCMIDERRIEYLNTKYFLKVYFY